jgi:surface antigen
MRIVFAFAAALLAPPALALNWNMLEDAPISRLKEDEVRAFRAFVLETLDQTPDGTTVEWKAPKTVFTSKITPLNRFDDAGMKCRDATIESNSKDRHMRGRYTFCKKEKSDWEFKIPSAKRPASPTPGPK